MNSTKPTTFTGDTNIAAGATVEQLRAWRLELAGQIRDGAEHLQPVFNRVEDALRTDQEIRAERERRRTERRRDQPKTPRPKAPRVKTSRGRYRDIAVVELTERELRLIREWEGR